MITYETLDLKRQNHHKETISILEITKSKS